MAFGWSAGDILTAINFLLDVASALDDVSGAGHDYRLTTTFLEDLTSHALAPLLTCPALDEYPDYKANVAKQVLAIKDPVSKFMDKVKSLEKDLGVPHKGRARFFRGVRGKLKWHFWTSKEAERLKAEIEQHVRIVDQLMARLPVSMIHDFKQDMPSIVRRAVSDAWNAHDASSSGVNEATLEKLLEDIFARNFERYFGTQDVKFSRSPRQLQLEAEPPAYSAGAKWNVTTEGLRAGVVHLRSRCRLEERMQGGASASGMVTVHPEVGMALDRWWRDDTTVCLWVQGPADDGDAPSLVGEMYTMAQSAKIPVAAHFCETTTSDRRSVAEDQLVELLYSLIYQLVHNLPEDLKVSVDFDPESFAKLDMLISSFDLAVSLFRHLLAIQSTPVLILVEHFDPLDFGADAELRTRIDVLLTALNSRIQIPGKVNKTLLYTTEPSMVLLNGLDPECIVDASQLSGSEGFFAFGS